MILAFKQILSQSIADGALIITATRRLAKQWQPILVNSSVGPSPHIISLKDWLNNLWVKLEATGVTGNTYLLNHAQEMMLWKSIIESSTQGEHLLRIQATAKNVASAAGLLKQWDIPLCVLEKACGVSNEETQLFLQWAHAFNTILKDRACITQACLPTTISNILADRYSEILTAYSCVKKIKLLGFEDIPPQFQLFYTQLRLQGWEVTELKFPDKADATQYHKYAFYDQAAELQSAALWAKSHQEKVKYPGAIGIVVPDLAQCRSLVEQTFTQILEPLSELHVQQRVSDQFNISVALPLDRYPIIFAALKALILLEFEQFNVDDLLFLIRSPFLTVLESDIVMRAQHAEMLKKLKKQILSFAQFNVLSNNLDKIMHFKTCLPAKCSVMHWAYFFEQFLNLLSWPGERVLNSIEHQAVARWQMLLEEFAALEKVLEPQDLSSAIKVLAKLAQEIPFQGQSKPAPIHIMGILEASSQPFEYLWVSGLHNEAWPPIPKANPFLPIALQKKHQMPHASTEREYYFAQKLTDNLKNACDKVIFSYFKNDTVKQYQPSDLIADIAQESFYLEPTMNSISEYLFNTSNQAENGLESVIDSYAPAIQKEDYYQGGIGLIEAQSLCPFKAFAQYRLHAAPHNRPAIGLKASERGTLVHTILELIWAKIKNHKSLCALKQEALSVLVNTIICTQIQNINWKYPQLPEGFWEVEIWRLNEIIHSWLLLEKKRPPFMVAFQEQKTGIHLAGLEFNIRIDRLDYTENDETIIIDYKTGSSNLADSLQLAIYSVGSIAPKAVAFGKLQAQGCQFVGLSACQEMLPGVKAHENWEALLLEWKTSLETLVLEFKKGYAQVHPQKGEQSCRTCHLLQVCRLKSVENE